MAEIKEFVITDRRKFTAEGDVRPDAPPSEPKPPRPEAVQPPPPPVDQYESSARLTGPQIVPDKPAAAPAEAGVEQVAQEQPEAPTAEMQEQAATAFAATVDRLDTAIRAANPGMEAMPPMTFDRLVQSIYMQAIMQLGGGTEPGQQPQVDLLGARQSIDMLVVIAEKTAGNVTPDEANLISSALFEMRMGFMEITQMLARQAAAKAGGSGMPPAGPTGPSIVR
jgi:Domain of unknown function (DUF1844)